MRVQSGQGWDRSRVKTKIGQGQGRGRGQHHYTYHSRHLDGQDHEETEPTESKLRPTWSRTTAFQSPVAYT